MDQRAADAALSVSFLAASPADHGQHAGVTKGIAVAVAVAVARDFAVASLLIYRVPFRSGGDGG